MEARLDEAEDLEALIPLGSHFLMAQAVPGPTSTTSLAGDGAACMRSGCELDWKHMDKCPLSHDEA